MRICVLQSSYEGSNHPTEIYDDMPDPSLFTAQHEFHHRYLKKATAEAEIDAAIAEGYDLFFNFMWGQAEDVVAGIDAVRYLESRKVPFVGLNSTTLKRSKLEFYASARAAGLPVPASGADMNFPVFVKPAKMCASMLVDEHAVCHNQEELNLQLQRINELLVPRREEAAKANTVKPLSDGARKVVNHAAQNGSSTPSVNGSLPDHDDIVVQEYIPGRDYSVVVIEMGNTPVALNPTLHQFPPETEIDFQTFDIKFHPKLSEVLLLREDNPDLFDRMRELAERAWRVNEMQGSNWGNVDIRERTDGKLFILEVNEMPAIFYRRENEWEDIVIREFFPGGHRALINSVITTTLLQAGKHEAAVKPLVAVYDGFASTYDTKTSKFPVYDIVDFLVKSYDFSGTVLDLGCGTGIVGRKLYIHQKQHNLSPSRVVGNDFSQGMVDQNPIPESYAEYRIAPIQELIMNLTEQFDHIISYSTLMFLDEITLSAVLARMFQVARKSITFTVDEVPESYSETLQQLMGVRGWNNLAHVEGFGVPRGWRVAYRNRQFGWTSPHTGVDVYVTCFRFEALKPCKHRGAA